MSKHNKNTTADHVRAVIAPGERVQYGNLTRRLAAEGYPVRGVYGALNDAGCVHVTPGAYNTETVLVERLPSWRRW